MATKQWNWYIMTLMHRLTYIIQRNQNDLSQSRIEKTSLRKSVDSTVTSDTNITKTCLHTPYGYAFIKKITKNEMGGACRAYGGQERRIQGFGGET
jgi:hypothetical protein